MEYRVTEVAPIGLAAIYVFGGFSTFFAPLAGFVDTAVLAVGWAGGLMALVWDRGRWPSAKVCGILGVVLCVVAIGSVTIPLNYDTGLYYLQVLRHVESEPVAFGIANIHERFGFNSAMIVLSAVFRGGPFGLDGAFVLPGAMFLLFAAYCLEKIESFWRSGKRAVSSHVAAFVLCAWLANAYKLLFEWYSHGPNGDIPGAIMCCWAFVALLSLAEAAAERESPEMMLWVLSICVVLGASLKLSQSPILLLLPAGWLLVKTRGDGWEKVHIYSAAVFVGLVAATWIMLGIVTSGCFAFPAGISCLTFLPWTVDPVEAEKAGTAIRAWARAPGMNPEVPIPGLDWVPIWTSKMLPYRLVLFDLLWTAAAGAVLVLLFRWPVFRGRENETQDVVVCGRRAWLGALAVCLLGLVWWFYQAPDPRFGIGFLISAPGVLFGGLAGFDARSGRQGWKFAVLGAIAAVGLGWALHAIGIERTGTHEPAWRNPPVSATQEYKTKRGLLVRKPVEGPQCWDEPGVCTFDERPNLARVKIWGRAGYIGLGAGAATVATYPPAAVPAVVPRLVDQRPGSGPVITFGSSVWSQEAITFQGRPLKVRWLQKETEFLVTAGGPGQVKLRFELGTNGGARRVSLAKEGKELEPAALIAKDFFVSGSDAMEVVASLNAGPNRFVLRTDRECTEISPGRATCLLLVGDIGIGNQ